MGIRGIIRNVHSIGIKNTYELHQYRKPDVPAKEQRAYFFKELFPLVYESASKKPVKHKVVIMERGERLSLNFQYLIKYLKENTDYEIDIHVLQFRAAPLKEYYSKAANYVRSAATAEAIFVCTANDIMGHFELRPETTYIQLWHACGAFKKFGLSTVDKKFGKSATSHLEYPVNTNYSYVTVSSPTVTWVFEQAMGIKPESGIVLPVGVSRTDAFFDEEYIRNSRYKIMQLIPATKTKKIILYAPTFRGEVSKATSPDELDIGLLEKSLGSEYILITKHHQSVKQPPKIPEEYEGFFAFDMTRGKGITINELMSVADIMITDYSSVAFEYSLFTRPMLFFAFDLENYVDYRGLYYPYSEITPGPVVKTTQDIVDYIVNIDTRFEAQKVIDFQKRFMSACDGHSTERIVKLIGKANHFGTS